MDKTAPEIPTGLSEVITGNDVALDWSDSKDNEGGSGLSGYIVEVADNDSFIDADSNRTQDSDYSLSSLFEGIYYWRVKAEDNVENQSDWSNTDTFIIDTIGPDIDFAYDVETEPFRGNGSWIYS
jgi:hypothetical protein